MAFLIHVPLVKCTGNSSLPMYVGEFLQSFYLSRLDTVQQYASLHFFKLIAQSFDAFSRRSSLCLDVSLPVHLLSTYDISNHPSIQNHGLTQITKK
jgi:hypothetical protein